MLEFKNMSTDLSGSELILQALFKGSLKVMLNFLLSF